MKRTLALFLLTGLILAACSFGQAERDAQATEIARMTRVADAVLATRTAMAEKTQSAPTITPSPEKLPLDDAILTSAALNVTLGIWPLTPAQSTVPSSNPLCLMSCYQELWISNDGRATLQISLFEFANRDLVVTKLREIKTSQEILGVIELDSPDYTELPTDSWIQDNQSSGSRYTLHTRQGRALIILTIFLPQYEQEQNLLFLSVYADKQLEMLESAGW